MKEVVKKILIEAVVMPVGIATFVTVASCGFYKMIKSEDTLYIKHRRQIIQELCEKEDYTFCEIEKIVYRERTETEEDVEGLE